MKALVTAIQFLTILPVRPGRAVRPEDFGPAIACFPLVGLFLGLILAAASVPAAFLVPPALSAALLLALSTVLTGAFHLDALADTFDALALKSTGDREADRRRRLEVMRDSASGAVGVSALVVVLLLKYAALVVILEATAFEWPRMASLLLLWPVLGRWSMVPALVRGRPARPEGLGRTLIERAGPREFLLSLPALACAFAAAAGLWSLSGASPAGLLYFMGGDAVMAYLIAEAAHRAADRLFGGLSGDVLGAINEFTETAYLIMVTAWLPHSI